MKAILPWRTLLWHDAIYRAETEQVIGVHAKVWEKNYLTVVHVRCKKIPEHFGWTNISQIQEADLQGT